MEQPSFSFESLNISNVSFEWQRKHSNILLQNNMQHSHHGDNNINIMNNSFESLPVFSFAKFQLWSLQLSICSFAKLQVWMFCITLVLKVGSNRTVVLNFWSFIRILFSPLPFPRGPFPGKHWWLVLGVGYMQKTMRWKSKLGYSQFVKRVRRAKLGVAKGKKRTDVCPTCQKFDAHVRLKIENIISETETILAELCPNYFMYRLVKAPFTEDTFDRACSPDYISDLMAISFESLELEVLRLKHLGFMLPSWNDYFIFK